MTRRSRRSTLLVPVLAGLLTLAACSHGEGGNQSGSAQSPQSHSGSHEAAQSIPMSGEYPILPNGKLGRPVDWVEPHEPQLPSAATNMDAFGARYFAEYYLNLLAYSINTGNTTTLKKVSSPECKVCQSYVRKIENLDSNTDWVDSMRFKIDSFNSVELYPEESDLYLVEFLATSAPYVVYLDGELTSFEEERVLIQLDLRQANSEFTVNRFFAKERED